VVVAVIVFYCWVLAVIRPFVVVVGVVVVVVVGGVVVFVVLCSVCGCLRPPCGLALPLR